MQFRVDKRGDSLVAPGLKEAIASLKDWSYRMEIVRDYKLRTWPQNNLLHAWLLQLEKESHVGYEAEEWKEVFRNAFLCVKKRSPLDRRKWVVNLRSTASLSTVEFNEFLEKIRLAALTRHVLVKLEYPDDPFFADLVNNPPPVSIGGF